MAGYVILGKKLDDQEVKDRIKEYILVMLGAPVVKIELNDEQLTLCIDRVCGMMKESAKVESEAEKLMIAEDGALALAKMVLGRVRAKFGVPSDVKGVNTMSGHAGSTSPFIPADGKMLLKEGKKEYRFWQSKVFDKLSHC